MNHRIRQWIDLLIMVTGLGLLTYPFLLGAREQHLQQTVVEEFHKTELRREGEQPSAEPAEAPTQSRDLFYEAAAAYNASLLLPGQDAMTSRADVEEFALSALDYGAQENIIGTLQIPRLEVELGLYLGANTGNMAKGAAIFGMTSLPLGGESENTAIAGHRGWRGTPMFRDIQKLQPEDPIYVTTPWQTLTYRVCDIQIVTPEDNGWCKIQPGRTLISLMTCHPYGQNSQRYIVVAELSREEKPSQTEILASNAESFDPSPRTVTVIHSDGTRETASVDPVSIQPDGSEYGAAVSNFVILAEDRMRPVAWIAAGVVGASGIWLTVQSINDFRKRWQKKENET